MISASIQLINMDPSEWSKMFEAAMLFANKKKPTNKHFGLWLLTENLLNDNLVTDIGSIDYTSGEDLLVQDGSNLIPITSPFCNNIMLVKIFDLDECEELDNRRFVLKKDLSNAFNLYLRGKFSEIVSSELEVEAKLTYQLNRKSGMPEKILQALGKDNLQEVQQKYQNPVGVLYRVELADVPIAALMGELPKLLEQLLKNNCFLLDLDITQDFAGIFNKSIMCDFLTTNHCFCLKGKLKEDYNVISDDIKEVGIDCLTWVSNNNNVRVKFYNKFICQMTSLETNKLLGNDVINFIVCPDTRLRKTFASNLAKMHGVTRLEAKICNYSLEKKSPSKTFDPIQDSLLLMNDIENYFRKAPLFSVSLSKMWTKLSDTLKNSCCLVYNNLLQYVYWGNSLTKKLTGVQVKLPTNPEQKDVMISYAIRAFSFNSLPINYVEIGEDTNNRDNIIFTKKRFIKSGETYFSKSTTLFSTIDLKVNLDELGLVRTKNIIPQVLRKKTNIDSKVPLYLIEEMEPLFPIRVPELTPNSVTGPSSRKRKVEYDEIHGKRRKLELMECTEYIIEQEPYRQPIDFQNEMKYLIEQFEKSKLE